MERLEKMKLQELEDKELVELNGGIIAESIAILSFGLAIAYYKGYYDGKRA